MLAIKDALLCAALLIGTLLFFEHTNIDIWLQNYFFDAATPGLSADARWVIDRNNAVAEFWGHTVPRILLTFAGIAAALGFCASFFYPRARAIRFQCLFLLLAFALVPSIVAGAKRYTNTYCPLQLAQYGGDKPYVKVLDPYPDGYAQSSKGRCFPAGHATAGFAYLALFFVARTAREQRWGIACGLAAGWVLGIFQMLRGMHFLSHTLIAMLASWLVLLILDAVFQRYAPGWRARRAASSCVNDAATPGA